jgi:hypothetical protein
MRKTLRRELRLLRWYAALNTLIIVVLATAAFRQAAPQKFEHITVQRLDVVDANGTLRMVISNKDRMHPGQLDGKVIDRPRPVAGMLFFNEAGDEVGGLTYTGREVNGVRQANAGIMFDQLGPQRQGCAVFHQGIGGTTADKLRLQLYTYVHELGHCFNLLHSWQKSLATPPGTNRPGSTRTYSPSVSVGSGAA